MPKIRINPLGESKLSKTIAKFSEDTPMKKTGFVNSNDKTIYFKTKSFRLRQSDFANLSQIVHEINKESERRNYSDSEVIRGIINYVSINLESNIKKLIKHVKDSS